MESLDKQTETTSSRISALKQIHAKYHCKNTALWLSDRSTGYEELLSSYHVGDPDVHALLVGATIRVSSAESEQGIKDVLSRIQVRFATITNCNESVTPIAIRPTARSLSHSGAGSVPLILGVVILQHDGNLNDVEMEDVATYISNTVEFTRLDRIATCVTNAQDFLSKTSKKIPSFLSEIGFFMLNQLNSRRYLFINADQSGDWLEIKGDSLEQLESSSVRQDFTIEEIGPGRSDKVRQVELRYPLNGHREPAILIPISQAGYIVQPVPFAKQNEYYRSLCKKDVCDIKLIFLEKSVVGYLQDKFSDSDVAIANAVFGFIGKYIESIVFENNAHEVISHLETDQMVQDDAASILKILARITRKFKSITILRAGRFERSIHFDKISETREIPKLHEYLAKVKISYFKKFYETVISTSNNNHPFFGIDLIDNRIFIEIHFPRYGNESRLYLIEFDGEVISESALRSLISLFSDLYSRVMREENIRERGNYLMQVRHAVIHHFSAANRSLKSIRPLWERGQRDKEYWLDLLSDPLIGSDLARTISSLGQANLIIENGRFMIGELDSGALNRKPYRIAELIASTLDILKYNRDDKRIGIISKISGSPPKSMRGDGPLLSIALMNLFDNAIKYSPHFMKIRWRLDYLTDRYRLAISSVGDKLDANARLMLFQEGYRGIQSDRLNRRHGTGLGLPVAYKILKAHSRAAKLDFEAFEHDAELTGSGNTFFFEMPYFSGLSSRADSETDARG